MNAQVRKPTLRKPRGLGFLSPPFHFVDLFLRGKGQITGPIFREATKNRLRGSRTTPCPWHLLGGQRLRQTFQIMWMDPDDAAARAIHVREDKQGS